MSRRSRFGNAASAFGRKGGRVHTLANVARDLGRKHAEHYQIGLTYDEFLSLYCTPEGANSIRELAALVECDGGSRYRSYKWAAADGTLSVQYSFQKKALVPINGNVIAHNGNDALVERVTEAINQRARIGKDYARVKKVLYELDKLCASPEQIRYVWPGVLILCAASTDNELKDLGARLNEFKQPGKLPTLPVGLRDACRTTATTLAGSQLIPDAEKFSAPVQLALQSFKFQEPDLGSMETE